MTQVKDRTAKAPTVPTGLLTVITAPMFSGKTEELIRRLRRALYARRSVQAFTPWIPAQASRRSDS